MAENSLSSFFERLAGSVAATLQQLTGSEPQHSVTLHEDPQTSNTGELWAAAAMKGAPECRLAFSVDQPAGVFLARAMLSETPDEKASFTAEDAELLAEFFKQLCGRVSDDLRDLFDNEALEYAGAETPSWQPAMVGELQFQFPARMVVFAIQLAMEMVRRLTMRRDQPQPEAPSQAAAAALNGANNLDLLLDVPLAVTLRFGQSSMPLRDILQLASGSVIELDRQAEDAVDLLLDERLIARGQVMVVDGCYGLRVTEVCHG